MKSFREKNRAESRIYVVWLDGLHPQQKVLQWLLFYRLFALCL